uniref:DUF4283 domain-containing protein n=1 Tax=Quercus lobata TaxID=97700 RepID=A0A7N2MWR3_QUELO
MEAIAKTFKLLWSTHKGFKVRDMGNHRVVFVFLDASDVEKVMMGEPWTFNKHLVSLQKKVEKHTNVRRLEFVSTRFWVQVHDLPIGLNSSVAKDIVLEVYTVVDSESELEGCNFQRKLTHFDRECPTWLKSKGSLKDGDNSLSPGYKHLPRIRLKN